VGVSGEGRRTVIVCCESGGVLHGRQEQDNGTMHDAHAHFRGARVVLAAGWVAGGSAYGGGSRRKTGTGVRLRSKRQSSPLRPDEMRPIFTRCAAPHPPTGLLTPAVCSCPAEPRPTWVRCHAVVTASASADTRNAARPLR
jgi:hypothetical protein